MSTPTPYSDMTPAERLRGVARILAKGVQRCLERQTATADRDSICRDSRLDPAEPLASPGDTSLTVSRTPG